jgi:anti-sigma regulatory factor (Ser/Thr protein kinase)
MSLPLRLTTVLACQASAPSHAREWWRHAALGFGLEPDEDIAADLELCLSELMSNATQAGAKTVSIAVAFRDDVIELSVTDDAPGMPVLRTTQPTDEQGRGLEVIASLSMDWGVRSFGPRKTVWATLARP